MEFTKRTDLSNFEAVGDIPLLLGGILTIDTIVLFLARFYPNILGEALNIWYDRFGLAAVLSDIFIILIAFFIARYIYTIYLKPRFGTNPWAFLATSMGVAVVHDILFYLGAILPFPRGANAMMDVFKVYAQRGGAVIIGADVGLMVGSFLFATLYKSIPPHAAASSIAGVIYMLPYALYQRWK